METKPRTHEMGACVTKSRELRLSYWRTKAPEDLEAFKQAERERYIQHYKENKEEGNQRTKVWKQKQSKIIVKCEICGVEIKKPCLK